MAVLRTQNPFLYGSLQCGPEDVEVSVLKAAEQWLIHQVWDLGWVHPCHPSAAGLLLRSPGGSFSVLYFTEEKQLLFSCICALLEKVFKVSLGSLEDVGAQSSFPLQGINFPSHRFPTPLVAGTDCSQDKQPLNSKHYARMLYCVIALSFTSVNWVPKANGSLHSSAVMVNNRRIKAFNWGEIPLHRQRKQISTK